MTDEDELKTLNDMKGIYSNGNKQLGKLAIYEDELRDEAVKRVKSCCGECRTDNETCDACKRDIWFNNLTERDLK